MNFEFFGPSRDLLYLGSLLLGLAAGAFLITRKELCTPRRKSRLVSVILCLTAGFAASLAASIILTRGLVFTVGSVYPFVFLFLALGIVGICYPRVGGCTIIFAAGLIGILVCFTFLVFPGFQEPVKLTIRSSGGGLIFRHDEMIRNVHNDGGTISFEASSITAYPAYPLIGGERRGLITRVLKNNEELFTLTNNLTLHSGERRDTWGFSRENHVLSLPSGALPPGISLSVLFDGERLYFDPPIQF